MSDPTSGTDLGELIAGVAAAVAGLTGWLSTRGGKRHRRMQAQVEEAVDELREDIGLERERVDAAMDHIYALRDAMREAGLTVPPLPDALRARPRSARPAPPAEDATH